ncbi:MAG: hypothetical protein PWQ96_982 [Clostridia bacterium]|jgi:sporulation protein YabP|nr:sporulation protein YabP [Clostridiales bacterium]MDK2985340.1 hypothetical protein [Clostridia bacterium]
MESMGNNIIIKNREWISVSGVRHVDNYDDKHIFLQTSMGNLIIKGEELNIKGLNLDEGKLEATGHIESLSYTEEQGARTKNILKRILK